MNFRLEDSKLLKPKGYILQKENCEKRNYFISTFPVNIPLFYKEHGNLKKLKIRDVGENTKAILELILDENIDFEEISRENDMKKSRELDEISHLFLDEFMEGSITMLDFFDWEKFGCYEEAIRDHIREYNNNARDNTIKIIEESGRNE
jgi:hypothetical protein